ncbi:MAG: hypothetical protein Kow00127_20980 [Bacteroidales bacterium]
MRYGKLIFVLSALIIQLTIPKLLIGQNNIARFNHLDVEDGLPENTIRAILQDSRGFMWFATWNGLCRYDGYQFKIFKHISGNSTSLPENKITCLFEDHKKRIWVGSYGGGVSLYDEANESFVNVNYDPQSKSKSGSIQVLSMFEDSRNRLWVGTNRTGISFINLAENTEQENGEPIRDLSFNYIRGENLSFSGKSITNIEKTKTERFGLAGLTARLQGLSALVTLRKIINLKNYGFLFEIER